MAVRPLAFGAHFKKNGRSVRVRKDEATARGYIVEVGRVGKKPQARDHGTLQGALRDFAASWRARLH